MFNANSTFVDFLVALLHKDLKDITPLIEPNSSDNFDMGRPNYLNLFKTAHVHGSLVPDSESSKIAGIKI